MICLAFETSSESGSIALHNGEQLLGQKKSPSLRQHSEFLLPAMQELLHEQSLQLNAIELLALGLGPGSFTGIRVSLSFVQALAYSLNIPVYGKNSLEVLAHSQQDPTEPLFVAVNAHRGSLYCARFTAQQMGDTSTEVCPIADFHLPSGFTWRALGNGWPILFSHRPELRQAVIFDEKASPYPCASTLAELAVRSASEQRLSWDQIRPLYLRVSEPEEKVLARS